MPGQQTYGAELGSRIKQARLEAELSQSELARRLTLTRPSVANIEAGRQNVLAETVMTIATILDCDPRWLLTGWGPFEHLGGVVVTAGRPHPVARPES